MAETRTRATATIAYNGSALAEGRMDVRDLAPALLALGQACQGANRALNPQESEITTYVRSDMKAGSFEISLDVVQAIDQARQLLSSNRQLLADAEQLLKVLGLLGSGIAAAGVGVFQFLKWLKNREYKAEEKADGSVNIAVGSDNIQISRSVFILAQNQDVRTAVEEVVRPLQRSGIDTFEVRSGPAREVVASSADIESFRAPRGDEIRGDLLLDNEYTAVLEVVRPYFKPGHRWGLSDGRNTVGVDVKDERFIGQVGRREVTFGKGDALRVKLRTRTIRDETGALKSTHTVTEVIEILTAPSQTQRPLFPPKPDPKEDPEKPKG